ncbi:hypothetical protein A2625_04905 [candidate division WOR-1 bacterium RIFCSPHIGHO2_01_FULL_53_15]|uniref:Uncharacterized protein n=1 Tax=candidate division WOR-1 bacterium RIFCSPHIGHO2_01_FULL_53_15 TaxID=1802564 RepID=A0A1F4Q2H0_UNCSA|nr:MAG: hypothetical protein A2625_04905 [candidate division WOR-1 bacterium RIFCSPHIGHO2_01_FULL_53_15]OGC13218.1 MAG: hypothetical protein A3D23_01160 [candidate division WOR-1 bacterium RIFCSPHIGHO2_02_FULL_53_26]
MSEIDPLHLPASSSYLPAKRRPSAGSAKSHGHNDDAKIDAPKEYVFRYDSLWHMETGAVNLISVHQLVEDWVIRPWGEAAGLTASGNGRLLELIPTAILSLYAGGMQHEIFGHGARFREIGFGTKSDLRFWKLKFGQVAITGNSYYIKNNKSPYIDRLGRISAAGGMEATQVMSKRIAQQTAIGGGGYDLGWLYLDTKLDTTEYILANSPAIRRGIVYPYLEEFNQAVFKISSSAFDISSYWRLMGELRLEELVDQYGLKTVLDNDLWHGPNFNFRAIDAGALWNALDPTLWYSAYRVYDYIDTGRDTFSPPSFLPRTNFALTTRGPDFYFRLPFKADGTTLFDPYIRSTANHSENNFGAGLEMHNLYLGHLSGAAFTVNPELHGWYKAGWQGGFGYSLGTGISAQIQDRFSIGGGGYYKTEGPLMGKVENAGFQWYLQAGISL